MPRPQLQQQKRPDVAVQNSFAGLDSESERDREDVAMGGQDAVEDADQEPQEEGGEDDGMSSQSTASDRVQPLPPERAAVPYDYYAVLDFECTCDRQGWLAHEIIEFPVVFLNAITLEVDMVFRRFVRPAERPRLTDFCRELTGISQADVDAAKPLRRVMAEFHEFLREHSLVGRRSDRSADLWLFCICADGPWDLRKFLRPECHRKRIRLEEYWRTWVDVRAAVSQEVGCGRTGISQMLHRWGMDFEGRPHSGLDDARNIARLVEELLRRGCRVVPGRQ